MYSFILIISQIHLFVLPAMKGYVQNCVLFCVANVPLFPAPSLPLLDHGRWRVGVAGVELAMSLEMHGLRASCPHTPTGILCSYRPVLSQPYLAFPSLLVLILDDFSLAPRENPGSWESWCF